MKIYGIDDNVLLSVSVTNSAQHEEEMMKSDFVRLSWKSNVHTAISVGSYIIPFADGLKYRLIEPYEPQQDSEDTFTYQPEFQHPKMWLTKVPFTYATKNVLGEDVVQQEWEYTGLTVTLLNYVVDFINTAFGFTTKAEKFALTIIGSVDTNVSVSFSSADVISALSAIASACTVNQCEWHLSWKHKALYFGQVSVNLEETIPTLKVGENIGKTSISDSSDGYYNVFYPQGSTRNMSTLAASGENVSTGIRLGLNKTKYPTGEVDTRADKNEPKQTLALTFDDIYPHVDCYAYNIRKRTRYLLDDQNNKVVSSYNADGSVKEYKKYTVWYMRLAYPLTAKKDGEEPIATTTETLNGKEQTLYWYDYVVEDNQILDGYTLCGTFKVNTNAGALASSLVAQPSLSDGFELTFHKTAQTIPANETTGDSGVSVLAGDFEIIFSNNNGTIIPTNESEGLIPRGSTTPSTKNNIVILYNIVMGDDEIEAAQDELEAKIKEEIAYRFSDLKNYTFSAYPNVWAKNNPNLYIGQRVVFDDGNGYSYTTRILKLVTNLDYDIVQEITVGNSTIKGTVSQLKEDVQGLINGTISVGSGLSYEQVVNIVKNYSNRHYLRKDVDDTAHGLITFEKGLVSEDAATFNEAVSMLKDLLVGGNASVGGSLTVDDAHSTSYEDGDDFMSGHGMHYQTANGKSTLAIDNITVRNRMRVALLEIMRQQFSAGNLTLTGAGAELIAVKPIDAEGGETAETPTAYRCYFKATDGDRNVQNMWHEGDIAVCRTFNLADTNYNAANRIYARVVLAVSTTPEEADGQACHYIDLANTADITIGGKTYPNAGLLHSKASDGTVTISENDVPMPQDDVAHLGSITDTDRQNAIQLVAVGDGSSAVILYRGINEALEDLSAFEVIKWNPDNSRVDARRVTYYSGSRENHPFVECGDWTSGTTAHASEVWQHNGSSWYCEAETTDEPSDSSSSWRKIAAKGDPGKDGTSVTISSTSVQYATASQGTDASTVSGWQTTVPTTTDAEPFLWTRTVVTYSDKTETTSYSVSRRGKDGATPSVTIGSDGYWYIDGVKTSDKAVGDDGHNPYVGSDGYWYTWDNTGGKFASTGIKAQGEQGIPGTSVTVTSTETAYQLSASGTTMPTGTWSKDVLAATDAQPYLWTKVVVTYSDGNSATSYSVGYKGKDGSTPTVTISDDGYWVIDGTKTDTKAQGTNGATPTVTIGSDGYWYINGTKTDTKAQGEQGEKGNTGDNGESMHIAYSTEYPVTKDSFTKEYNENVRYIGIYTSNDSDTQLISTTSDGSLIADGDGSLLYVTQSVDGGWDDPRWVWQPIRGKDGDSATSYYTSPQAVIVTENIDRTGITDGMTDDERQAAVEAAYTDKSLVYDIPQWLAIHEAVGSADTIVKAKDDGISCTEGAALLVSGWKTLLQGSFTSASGYDLKKIMGNASLAGSTSIVKIVLSFTMDGGVTLTVPIFINRLGTIQKEEYGDMTLTVRNKKVTWVDSGGVTHTDTYDAYVKATSEEFTQVYSKASAIAIGEGSSADIDLTASTYDNDKFYLAVFPWQGSQANEVFQFGVRHDFYTHEDKVTYGEYRQEGGKGNFELYLQWQEHYASWGARDSDRVVNSYTKKAFINDTFAATIGQYEENGFVYAYLRGGAHYHLFCDHVGVDIHLATQADIDNLPDAGTAKPTLSIDLANAEEPRTLRSKIQQTSDKIEAAVEEGQKTLSSVGITKDGITLRAATTKVQNSDGTKDYAVFSEDGSLNTSLINTGELVAKKIETDEQGAGHVTVENGLMQVFNPNGQCQIRFGYKDGYMVLSYYDNAGNLLYDLGPGGLDASNISSALLTLVYAKEVDATEVSYASGSTTETLLTASDDIFRYSTIQTGTNDVIYQYKAARINNTIVKDDARGLTAAQAAEADGQYFASQTLLDAGGNVNSIKSGVYVVKGTAVSDSTPSTGSALSSKSWTGNWPCRESEAWDFQTLNKLDGTAYGVAWTKKIYSTAHNVWANGTKQLDGWTDA